MFFSLVKVCLMFHHDLNSKKKAFGVWHIKKMTTTIITSKESLFSRIKMSVCVWGPHQDEKKHGIVEILGNFIAKADFAVAANIFRIL